MDTLPSASMKARGYRCSESNDTGDDTGDWKVSATAPGFIFPCQALFLTMRAPPLMRVSTRTYPIRSQNGAPACSVSANASRHGMQTVTIRCVRSVIPERSMQIRVGYELVYRCHSRHR
jgi:hypothetical protein